MPKRVSPPGSAFTQSRRPICTTPNAISLASRYPNSNSHPTMYAKTPADDSAFTELKASIAAHGLLENLIAPFHGTRSGWRHALRRDRWRSAVGCDAGAGRRRWRWKRITPCPAA